MFGYDDTGSGDEPSGPATWRSEPNLFSVFQRGSRIEVRIVAGGLKFVGQARGGEQAEMQLDWDGTLEFIEWVYHRLPLPEA